MIQGPVIKALVTILSCGKTKPKRRRFAPQSDLSQGVFHAPLPFCWLSAGLTLLSSGLAAAETDNAPRNLILFVPDGLRVAES